MVTTQHPTPIETVDQPQKISKFLESLSFEQKDSELLDEMRVNMIKEMNQMFNSMLRDPRKKQKFENQMDHMQKSLFKGKGKYNDNYDAFKKEKGTSLFRDIGKAIGKFANDDITLKHEISEDSLSKITSSVGRQVKEKIEETVEGYSLKSFTTPISAITFVIAAIQWYRQGKWSKELFIAAIALLLPEAYSAARPYLIKIWCCLVHCCDKDKKQKKEENEKKETKYEDQILDSFGEYVPDFNNFTICPTTLTALSGALAGIVLSWIIKDSSGVKQTLDKILKLKDFPNLKNGIFGILEWFMITLESIVNFIRRLFGADKWFFWSGKYPEAEEVIKRGYTLCSKLNKKDRMSVDDVKTVDKTVREIIKVESVLPRDARRELVLIANLRRAMIPIEQRARRTNVLGAGSRVPPVSVLFSGESAIGKSSAQVAMAKIICARLLPQDRLVNFERNPNIEIFSKNEVDEYWEGYNGQFISYHDDIGYRTTVAGQTSAESNMIPEVNEVPYALNMAFGDKGSTYFTSEVVMGTSNFYQFDPDNIAYPAAFVNRWHAAYVCSVKPTKQYCENPEERDPMKRRLKPREDDGVYERYEHLIWIEYDIHGYHAALKNNVSGRRPEPMLINYLKREFTFDEVVEHFIGVYIARRTKSVKLLKHQNELILEHLKIRKESPPPEIAVETGDADSDCTPIPGKYQDQAGEEKTLKQKKKEEQRKHAYHNFTPDELNDYEKAIEKSESFAFDMIFYNSYSNGRNVFYAKKPEVLHEEHVRRLQLYTQKTNVMIHQGKFKKFGDDEHLKYLCDSSCDMKLMNCPLSKMDYTTVLTLPGKRSKKDLEDYFTGYYMTQMVSVDFLKESLADLPPVLWREYPSVNNARFIELCELSGMDCKEIGSIIGAITKLTIVHSKRWCYKTRKYFKDQLFKVYEVSKENLKSLMSGEWLTGGLTSILKYSVYIVAGLAATGYLTKMAKKIGIFPVWTQEELEGHGINPQERRDESNSVLNVKSYARARRNDAKVAKMTNQAGTGKYQPMNDKDVLPILRKIKKSNVYVIKYPSGNFLGSCVFINEYIAICPRHFRDALLQMVKEGELNEKKTMTVVPFNSKEVDGNWFGAFKFLPDRENMRLPKGRLAQMDVCILDFRGICQQPKSPIIKYWYSEEDLDEESNHFRGTIEKILNVGESECETFDMTIAKGPPTKSGRLNEFIWNYKGHTSVGSCGSLVAIHDNSSGKRKIVGMHVVGSDCGLSGACVIMREDLEEELAYLQVVYSDEGFEEKVVSEDYKEDIPHIYLYSEKQVEMPDYSKIVKSPLCGKITKPSKIPVRMKAWKNKKEEEIDPIKKALYRQVPKSVYINHKLVDISVHEYFKFCNKVSPLETRGPGRIYSIEEACAGIPGDPYIKGIPRGTSPGHPHNLLSMKKGGGKYLWFGREEQYDFTNDFFKKLKARCLSIIHRGNEGHRYTHVAFLFPKDECLSEEKVEEGKVRFIAGFPLDHTISGRCLNLECFKYIVMNRIQNWTAGGMDVHSLEWDILGKKLEGASIIDADQKNFDGRNKGIFIKTHTQFTNMYYHDDNQRAREIIDMELANCRLVYNNAVFERVDGLGSGAYPTLFANTHSNINNVVYCVHKIMLGTTEVIPERSRELIFLFFTTCYGCFQGDDCILAIRGMFLNKVTFSSLRDAMEENGYQITPALKNVENPPEYVTLEQASFLKRRFVKIEGRYYAPLDMESIDNMIQWCNKKNYVLNEFYLVVETYLKELSIHGKEIFVEKYNKLIKALVEVRLPYIPKYNTWEEYFYATTSNYPESLETEWNTHELLAEFDNQQADDFVESPKKEKKTVDKVSAILADNLRDFVQDLKSLDLNDVEISQAIYNVVKYDLRKLQIEDDLRVETWSQWSEYRRLRELQDEIVDDSEDLGTIYEPNEEEINSWGDVWDQWQEFNVSVDSRNWHTGNSEHMSTPKTTQESVGTVEEEERGRSLTRRPLHRTISNYRVNRRERSRSFSGIKFSLSPRAIKIKKNIEKALKNGNKSKSCSPLIERIRTPLDTQLVTTALGYVEAPRVLRPCDLLDTGTKNNTKSTLSDVTDEDIIVDLSPKTSGSSRPLPNIPLYHNQSNMDTNKRDQERENDHEEVVINQATTAIHTTVEEDRIFAINSLEDKLRAISLRQNTVQDFLSKKIEIANIGWLSTDGPGTKLLEVDINYVLFNNTAWTNKLSGFLNFRGNAVLTLIFNATPFMNGLFRCVWCPYVANDADWSAIDYLHTQSLIQLSQLPGVFHSVSTDTVTMSIPLLGPVNTISMDEPLPWAFGFFRVYSFTTLGISAAGSVDGKVYLSFEKSTVDTPYYNQAGFETKIEKKGAGSHDEKENIEQGVITKYSGLGVEVVKGLATVPMLQPIATPAQWIMEGIHGLAKHFGWSKPNLQSDMMRVCRNIMFYGPNCDGTDPSTSLALRADNKVMPLVNCSPYEGDEMSVNFIKTQWSYYDTMTMTTSDTIGTTLKAFTHCPANFVSTTTLPLTAGGTLTKYYFTPIAFLSNLFESWTGDVEIKLMFSKTAFHCGAISIVYIPTTQALGAFPYPNSHYNFREIVDLQTCEEFCFKVPYALTRPYLNRLDWAGHIVISVANRLKAPTTVAQEIKVLLLVRGAPNLQFQIPAVNHPAVVYNDQGALDTDTSAGCVNVSMIANAQEDSYSIEKQAYCMGEDITSLRQLISRYIILKWNKYGTLDNYPTVGISPYSWPSTYYINTAGTYAPSTTASFYSDLLSTIANCYMFYRGSMRFAIKRDVGISKCYILPKQTYNNGHYTDTTDVEQRSNKEVTIFTDGSYSTENSNYTLVRVPYYNNYPVSVVRPLYTNTQTNNNRYGPRNSVLCCGPTAGPNYASNYLEVQRAIGDDFQFSFWLGVPPMYWP